VDLPLLAYVFVRDNDGPGTDLAAQRVAEIPGVLEVHHVAGEDCFLAKVRAKDPESLGRLLRERIGRIASITSTRTTIVLGTVKESAALPIAAPAESLPEAVRV
jgi:Lrp/AsnC family leucine-responsive transcriptional regulator